MISISQIQVLDIPTDPIVQDMIADIWTENALMEHASVASFSRISLELMGLGAPADLLERSFQAGLDEIRHAQIAFSIASHYLGRPISPGVIPGILGSKIPKSTFKKFAFESFVYGYIGEGVSALVLRESAKISEEQELRELYISIADDEEKHSELGLDMLLWCLQEERNRDEHSIEKLFAALPGIYNFAQKYKTTKHAPRSEELKLRNYGVIGHERELQIRDDFYKAALKKVTDLLAEF